MTFQPFIPRNRPVYGADGRRLGWGIVYTPTDTEGRRLWAKHRDAVEWEPEGNTSYQDKDGSNVDFGQPDVYESLKAHMDRYGVPPPPFTSSVTGGAGELTSLACIQPTQSQLGRLSMATPDGESSGEMVAVTVDKFDDLPFTDDPINTTLRWTCKGFTVSHTPYGWMLYKGELEDVGLQITPMSPPDKLSNYRGLRERLSEGTRFASLELPLQLVRPDGRRLTVEEAGVQLWSDPEGTILPSGMLPRRIRGLSLPAFIQENGSSESAAIGNDDPKIFMCGYDGSAPQSHSMSFTCPATNTKALRFSTPGTSAWLTEENGRRSEIVRTGSRLSLANVCARLTCIPPVPSVAA